MTPREELQIFSAVISAATLVIIVRKMRRRRHDWRVWVPFLIISALTLVFYIAVQADWLCKAASDVSATLRLATQISLLFYAWYMPPETR